MLLLFQSVAEVGTWGRNNLDNMKVMLVAKGRHLDSVGRTIADTCFLFGGFPDGSAGKESACNVGD